MVVQHGEGCVRLKAGVDVAGSVRGNADFGKDLVCRRVFLSQQLRRPKSVHKDALPAGTPRMLQKMEELQSGWIGKVSVVGVDPEGKVGIGGIVFSQVCGEVPESTVVGLSNKGYPFDE